ncbi:hypothetical protein D3C81_1710410 [compost metagenome]
MLAIQGIELQHQRDGFRRGIRRLCLHVFGHADILDAGVTALLAVFVLGRYRFEAVRRGIRFHALLHQGFKRGLVF